jgi:Fe-S cluster assembly ATP-binding protein
MLRVEHLAVEVEGRKILRDINLHIKQGEVHVLFGPNGTGKSTLINAIMGFSRYKITGGRIFFKDEDITELPVYERVRRGVGVMIQRPPTVRGLAVRDMVRLCAGEREVDVEALAKSVNMENFLDRSVNDGFSGGEIKRSELLQLLAQQPDLLLLDEPESGVDIENIAVVGKAADRILQRGVNGGNTLPLKKRREGRSKSGLIITHTGHIMQYVPVDVAHVLFDGVVSCSGNPQEMFSCIQTQGYEACVSCDMTGGN